MLLSQLRLCDYMSRSMLNQGYNLEQLKGWQQDPAAKVAKLEMLLVRKMWQKMAHKYSGLQHICLYLGMGHQRWSCLLESGILVSSHTFRNQIKKNELIKRFEKTRTLK